MEKRSLVFTEIVEILGDRPFEPDENFKRFLDEIKNK